MRTASLTGDFGYFEDFLVGTKIQHARGATVQEVENNLLTKMVMNTAASHWNETALPADHAFGAGRVVFGLVTASMVFGLAAEDTSENSLRELGCTGLRFLSPVRIGDSLNAFTEVLAQEPAVDRDDAGVVHFKHWGVLSDGRVVFEGERRTLVKKRTPWRTEAGHGGAGTLAARPSPSREVES